MIRGYWIRSSHGTIETFAGVVQRLHWCYSLTEYQLERTLFTGYIAISEPDSLLLCMSWNRVTYQAIAISNLLIGLEALRENSKSTSLAYGSIFPRTVDGIMFLSRS